MKSPRRQDWQWPQWPPCQPTPTRWPTVQSGTRSPTVSIIRPPRGPARAGYSMPGNAPVLVKASLWQTPQAWTLIRHMARSRSRHFALDQLERSIGMLDVDGAHFWHGSLFGQRVANRPVGPRPHYSRLDGSRHASLLRYIPREITIARWRTPARLPARPGSFGPVHAMAEQMCWRIRIRQRGSSARRRPIDPCSAPFEVGPPAITAARGSPPVSPRFGPALALCRACGRRQGLREAGPSRKTASSPDGHGRR